MAARRPNILLLFADQHAAEVLGCAGHPDVATPNLDALAARGVRMQRAYCQNGICLPSRAALMTGQHPRSLGTLENRDVVRAPITTLAQALRAGGYHCAAFGKRHLRPVGSALDAGWHERASSLHDESPEDSYITWLEERGLLEVFAEDWSAEFARGPDGSRLESRRYQTCLLSARPTRLPEEATMEHWVADRTIDYLRRRKRDGQPFFCWSSFYRPHQPYTAHPRWLACYPHQAWGPGRRQGGAIRMPASLRQDPATLPPVFQEWHRGSNGVWRLDLARRDEQIYRDYIAAYYALVSEVDAGVGRILATLDELGMRDDTVIVYTADHGDFVGNHGMVEKCSSGHNIYEDILRIPMIIAGDGRFGHGTSSDLVGSIDLYPTLLDYAGIPAPAGMAGQSLRALLEQGRRLGREFLVSENWCQTSIISERYKLGRWLDGDGRAAGEVLFDRVSDPGELVDHSADPGAGAAIRHLHGLLADWESRTPDARWPRIRNQQVFW